MRKRLLLVGYGLAVMVAGMLIVGGLSSAYTMAYHCQYYDVLISDEGKSINILVLASSPKKRLVLKYQNPRVVHLEMKD